MQSALHNVSFRYAVHTLLTSAAVVLIVGCAESIALRGYANKPLSHPPEIPADSGAYIASTHVPWCVNLRHGTFTLEEVQHFRKKFYTGHRHLEGLAPAEGSRRFPTMLEELEKKSESVKRPTCWSVAQLVAYELGPEAHDHSVFALALPGGGSRATVFSAAVMFELQIQKILRRVDVISSVSGGSLTAGLYARSCQDETECAELYGSAKPILWTLDQEDDIFDQLGTSFIGGQLLRMAKPWNWLLYRTTRYTRTHTLAEVYASRLFSVEGATGTYGMTFRQLNPRGPNWWINAVNTAGERLDPGLRGEQFLFTLETFERELQSDLHDYPVAFGATASTAVPGVFHPLTVAAFPSPADSQGSDAEPVGYKHLVDGGLYDRLGGEAIRAFFKDIVKRERPCIPAKRSPDELDDRDCVDRAIAFVLDSGLPIEGGDATAADPRTPVVDLLVASNIAMAPFVLLEIQAQLRLDALRAFAAALNQHVRMKYGRKEWVFKVVAIRLRDVKQCVEDPLPCAEIEDLKGHSTEELTQIYKEFWGQVLKVPLSLRISQENAVVLRRAARLVVRRRIMDKCAKGGVFVDCTIPRAGRAPFPGTGTVAPQQE